MKIISCILLVALPALAQWRHFGSDRVSPEGFFGVGFTTPVNPLATRLDTGWNLAGGIGVSSQYVGILVDGMYTSMGINHSSLENAGLPDGNQRYWAVT